MIITQTTETRTEAAQALIDRGWQPVPIPAGAKGPLIKDWQNRQFTADDFRGDGNIGLKLGRVSGGLVDIDLDCAEAIELAYHFLPETLMIHGRKSKPCSHYWYVVTDALPDTNRYKDTDGATLIELRSNGGQTIIPLSVHPSGEQLRWQGDNSLEPARVSGGELKRRVALIAATSLIARHWPTNGGRHDCAMAVAGYLARGGMNEEEVVNVVRLAAEVARDDEVADRERAAEDTIRRMEQGGNVTGGPTLESLMGQQVVSKLNEWLGLRRFAQNNGGARQGDENEQRNAQRSADTLLSLAQASGATFFRTPEGEAYAHVPVSSHWETLPLRSMAAREWLRGLYYDETARTIGNQTVDDTLATLTMLARRGVVAPVYTRIASHNGALYVDLGDESWAAVEIAADGWRIVNNPPVYFRRSKGALPLPHPEQGGSLAELRQFVNVSNGDEWVLLLAWLIGAYHPTGPYAHLALSGAQGSAKSTLARLLRRLVDPHTTELRRAPERPEDVALPTRHNRVLAFDNLSHMPDWLSDMLCTLSTGGADTRRELYTNDEEVSFNAKMPAIFTGIGELAVRGDLLERTILLYPQPPARRQTEKQVYTAFEKTAPRILGALYAALSMALRNHVQLENPDRMADFEEWVVAAEPALGVEPGTFLAAYRRMLGGANQLALEASPVGRAVLRFMQSHTTWLGTATELLSKLGQSSTDHTDKRWPIDGIRLSNALKRVEPQLKEAGILVERLGNGGRDGRYIRLTRSGQDTAGGNDNAADGNDKTDSSFHSQPRQEAGRERWNNGNNEMSQNPQECTCPDGAFTAPPGQCPVHPF
jgi:hypothetical protein